MLLLLVAISVAISYIDNQLYFAKMPFDTTEKPSACLSDPSVLPGLLDL